MIGIYMILSPTGRIYVGQSVNIYKRKTTYKYGNIKAQIRLNKSISKYGWSSHIFKVIEECDISTLNERERYWQDYYNVTGKRGLNCKLTGFKDKSGILNESIKYKISKSLIGNKHSEQRKINQSKAQTGKKRSTEHKNNISISAKKRFLDIEERKKQGKKLCKPVIQYTMNGELIKEWESTNEIQRVLNISKSIISKCCNGKGYYKTAGGYKWEYKT